MIRPCLPAISGMVIPISRGAAHPTRTAAARANRPGPPRWRWRRAGRRRIIADGGVFTRSRPEGFRMMTRGGRQGRRADAAADCGGRRRPRRPLRSIRCAASTPTAALPPRARLSYTALVSLVPLAAIALGSLSVFPIFGQVHDQILALVFKIFRAVDRRAGGMVVPRLRQFGGADDRDRRHRHRRHRGSAAGHGRRPAQRDLAGHRAAAVGAAGPRLLDADHARPAADRAQPVAVDLFRDRRPPCRVWPASLSMARERLAARARARGAGGARIRCPDYALLADPELCGSLARRARSAR